MTDERAKRAAEKAMSHLSPSMFGVTNADVVKVASIIAAEYADVLAENERLRKRLKTAHVLLARGLAWIESDPPGHCMLAKTINAFLDGATK